MATPIARIFWTNVWTVRIDEDAVAIYFYVSCN